MDWFFLSVLVELYGNPDKHFPAGRPAKLESWTGAVFSAFQTLTQQVLQGAPGVEPANWVRTFWPRFLRWHHLILGTGFRTEMLADPRVAALHSNVDVLKSFGLLPHTPSKGLAARLRLEARKKGGHLDRNLSDDEVKGDLYALDDPTALTTDAQGKWILNVQLLYDRLRIQDRQEDSGVALPDVAAPDHGPAEVVEETELVRELRDVLDAFRDEGPAEAAAVARKLEGGSRQDLARKYSTTPDRIRGAEVRLDEHLKRFSQRLAG